MNEPHPDARVRAALTRLDKVMNDSLRVTGRQSVLIIRQEGGFVHRTINGRPAIDELDDKTLLGMIRRAK